MKISQRSNKLLSLVLTLALMAAGCSSPVGGTTVPVEQDGPTGTIPAASETATINPTGRESDNTPTAGPQIRCMNGALFVEDLSVPDDTDLVAEQGFTKSWRLRNTGTCTWNSAYLLVFARGDRLGAPDSIPLGHTPPGATLDLSVDLVAPSGTGAYAALFEIHAPNGEVIPVGKLQNIWARITVGGGPALGAGATPGSSTSGHSGACQYNENEGYIQQLASLINQARREANLPAYQWDSRLAKAAQGHSMDMGCNNFHSHTGSDGSWIGDRLAEAGYSTYHYTEIIAIGTPEDAMAQWRASPSHWEAVLDASLTDFGIGYVYVADSDYGGYITVDIARP